MKVYLKFLRQFLVLMIGVFLLVGCGGGGGGEYNHDVNSTDPQNEDSDVNDYPREKVEFPLTLDSKTSTHFNLSWTAPTGAIKYKLCQSSIDEVSYETAQTCDNLVEGSFFDATTSLNMSINSDGAGNILQQGTTYYFRVVAYNDSDEVVGVSSLVSDKLGNQQTNTSKLKKTGQTKSYDKYGNEVTDGSIKDDGYYQKGVEPSYTRDDDTDIVTDHITGLEWADYAYANVEKPWLTQENYDKCRGSNGQTKDTTKCADTSGDTATTYCANLTLGEHNDWRLPTIKELLSITDISKAYPAIDTAVFKNVVSREYWSSSTRIGDEGYAWVVDFYRGDDDWVYKSNNECYVRCVRDGQ